MRYYLSLIANELKRAFPQLSDVIYVAHLDEEGRILIQRDDQQNEFEYAGMMDNKGDYAYIRYMGDGEINYSPAMTKNVYSCGSHSRIQMTTNCRVVVCLRNWCKYNAEDTVRRVLMTTIMPDKNGVNESVKLVSATPIRSMIDSIAILKEESPKKQKQFDKNLIFVATDFALNMEITYF